MCRAWTVGTTAGAERIIALACLPGLAMVVCSAGCATDGPRRRGIRDVHVTDVGGYLDMTARQNSRDQKSKVGGTDVSTDETIFEESLNLTLDGYTYHPNLMEFALAGTFGLLQQEFEETRDGVTRSSSDDGSLDEFDLSATFLKKKPYPGTVYARRERAIEVRPFLPSLQTITTNYGLDWRYVSEKTPTSVQFEHTTTEFDPLGSAEEERTQESTVYGFDTAYNFSLHNSLGLRYSHQSINEEPFGFKYDSDDVSVFHRLDFGDFHQHQLESTVSYLDQRGNFDIERFQWRERLRLQHTETLRSWFDFEWLDRTQGSLSGSAPIDERSLMLTGSVEHQLFESLTSQVTAFGHRQEFGSGADVDRYGWNASFDYRKKNRWGVLRADYRFGFQRQDRSGGDQRIEVYDEVHQFQDPEPIILDGDDLQVSSIVITDEQSRTLYFQGSDYRIRLFANRVEIERNPTGRIAEGQTVLIDYILNIGGDFILDTTSHGFGIRQEFDFGLTPYYRFRTQDQTITPQRSSGYLPEDITAHIIGVEYRLGGLSLGAEYEDHESNISPFTGTRLNAGYTHRFSFGGTAAVNARWSDIQYETVEERRTQFLTLEGRYRHPISDRLNVEAGVQYRRMDDSISGDDRGVDADLTLEYNIRQTTFRLTYEYGTFDDDFTDNRHSALMVQVRRKF